MISFGTGTSLLSYLTAQTSDGTSSTTDTTSAAAKARAVATSKAALQVAGSTPRATIAAHALDKQQATLATDLRAAMSQAGVALSGAVEFSVSSDGKVAINASDADKAATTAFLKADTSRPSFATRIASQAKDALSLSASIQQSAAVSQAARYGGKGGVMALYNSLMQQTSASTAVFNLSATASSLTYPGSLAAKA